MTAFTPTDLLESVVGQLMVEFKKMYKNGLCELQKKVPVGSIAKNFNVHQTDTYDISYLLLSIFFIVAQGKKEERASGI